MDHFLLISHAGSQVKEELKDDIEMSEFMSQTVSKVKIEKPQSDKECGHESGTCNHLWCVFMFKCSNSSNSVFLINEMLNASRMHMLIASQ